MKRMPRRQFVKGLAGSALAGASALATRSGIADPPVSVASIGRRTLGRVVVIGGGFAGATAARYLRWLEPRIEVTLVTPEAEYFTCPFSNLVQADLVSLADLRRDYRALTDDAGVELVVDHARAIDPVAHRVETATGRTLGYDRLLLAPGVAFIWGSPNGYDRAASERMPHAWSAGRQTLLLKARLDALEDGATALISVPRAPFRCPPGPYERASLMAFALAERCPRSKVLILDANEHFSKQALFEQAWAEVYPGRIERIPASADGAVQRVDAATGQVFTDFEVFRPGLANIIPAQRAAGIAVDAGLTDDSGWCPVDPQDFASIKASDVHVLGDAAQAMPMPKSASAANSQAKQCAVAVVAALRGETSPEPLYHSTCYSLVGPEYGVSVSGLYRSVAGQLAAIEGAGGTSAIRAEQLVRRAEAEQDSAWYQSICRDAFG